MLPSVFKTCVWFSDSELMKPQMSSVNIWNCKQKTCIKRITCAGQISDQSNGTCHCVNNYLFFKESNLWLRTSKRMVGRVKGQMKLFFSPVELAKIMPLLEKPLLHEEAGRFWGLIEFSVLYSFWYFKLFILILFDFNHVQRF